MKSCTMAPPEPERMEQVEMGFPMPKNPVSISGSFPNLTIITHDGTIFKLQVKRCWWKFFKIAEVEWVGIPGPVDTAG